MSEKRKPIMILFAQFSRQGKKGKKQKIEIFRATEFETDEWRLKHYSNQYRLRINGKWFCFPNGKKYFWKTEIRDLFWRSLHFNNY